MATTITCDRCGKVLKDKKDITISIIEPIEYDIRVKTLLHYFRNYCDSCLPIIVEEIKRITSERK